MPTYLRASCVPRACQCSRPFRETSSGALVSRPRDLAIYRRLQSRTSWLGVVSSSNAKDSHSIQLQLLQETRRRQEEMNSRLHLWNVLSIFKTMLQIDDYYEPTMSSEQGIQNAYFCTREAGRCRWDSKRLKLPKWLATWRMNQQRDAQSAINTSNIEPTYNYIDNTIMHMYCTYE